MKKIGKAVLASLIVINFVSGWLSNVMYSFEYTNKPSAYGIFFSALYVASWILVLVTEISPATIKSCIAFWSVHVTAAVLMMLGILFDVYSVLILVLYVPMVGLAGITGLSITRLLAFFSCVMDFFFVLKLSRAKRQSEKRE